MAIAEEVPLAFFTIFLDIIWLVLVANLCSFPESFLRCLFADLVLTDCNLERRSELCFLTSFTFSPEQPVIEPKNIIGVDMGIANISVDSTGKSMLFS